MIKAISGILCMGALLLFCGRQGALADSIPPPGTPLTASLVEDSPTADGSFSKTAAGSFNKIADGSFNKTADGSFNKIADGSFNKTADGSSNTTIDDAFNVTVDDTYIEVHTGPGRGYPVFHVVERGETITLVKRRTDWIKISTRRGQSGWVKRAEMNKTLGPDGLRLQFDDPDIDAYIDRRWDMGVAVGDFDGADSLTLNLGYRFTKNLAAELKLSQATGQFSDNKLASLALVHQPFPDWRVSPYFTLGAGAIHTSPSATLVETEDRTDTSLLAGLGAYVYLNRRFVLRLEYSNHKILTSRDENEEVNEWKMGFSVFF